MWHMISIGYKDCRGCKGGIHHSFKQKTLTQMGSTRVVVVTSVGMKMENVYNSIRVLRVAKERNRFSSETTKDYLLLPSDWAVHVHINNKTW